MIDNEGCLERKVDRKVLVFQSRQMKTRLGFEMNILHFYETKYECKKILEFESIAKKQSTFSHFCQTLKVQSKEGVKILEVSFDMQAEVNLLVSPPRHLISTQSRVSQTLHFPSYDDVRQCFPSLFSN